MVGELMKDQTNDKFETSPYNLAPVGSGSKFLNDKADLNVCNTMSNDNERSK